MACAIVGALALLAVASAHAAPEARQVAQAPAAPQLSLPSLIPPVPRLAVRPPPRAVAAGFTETPLVPPVPQPAVRPQRLAALSDPKLDIPPPTPRLITRREWLAALYEREPGRLPPAPGRPARRDDRTERLIACLKPEARALLERIEAEFGPMQIISTCRPGALIAGTGRISRHATGHAIDFEAGKRKADVVRWLIANHHAGGTMTYRDMSHIHADIGHRFVSLGAWSGR
jgi:hypothetical protein